MTKDLTEQWKKGKLKAGLYYVKNEFENIFISEYSEDYDYIGDKVVKDFFTEVSEITEVIAPVPSYKEWNQLLKFLEEFNALDVTKENQQLKELLKECRDELKFMYDTYGQAYLKPFDDILIAKIDEVVENDK